ncbi:MAG: glycosyltransferase [Gammaproteobacteria bacterium]|nr:MAG: glycosyltransferase [Gammaproteobacteria bacterium]
MREKLPILNRPLRVMHIISGDLWAGAESQAFTLLKHLHANTILHVILMNDGELCRRLQGLNIPVTLILESELSSVKILTHLITIIRTFKPDILHTHRQKENILGNLANVIASFPLKKRTPSVRTAHGAPEFQPTGKQKVQVWMDNFVGKYLQQAIISVSTDLSQKLELIFPSHKIRVIQNGVDSTSLKSEVTTTEFRSAAPDHVHIGIIGRIEPVKRVDLFIDMAAILVKSHGMTQLLHFHIIGEGSLRSEMEKKVGGLNLNDRIHFLGHREDVASCIDSLDVIVMCSDHEGTPMTALEAMALGTPLVAHKVGGLVEILQDYPKLLVANHSSAGYAAALQNLLSEKKLNVALNPIYEATTNAGRTLDLYKTLAA